MSNPANGIQAQGGCSSKTRQHKVCCLAIEPRVAYVYLHPPFDETDQNPNSTHFILKNMIKQDVCFKVRSRQSKHINIRVSPSSGIIYKHEESLTIKVMVDPVKDETCLEKIASGKEKIEVGCMS